MNQEFGIGWDLLAVIILMETFGRKGIPEISDLKPSWELSTYENQGIRDSLVFDVPAKCFSSINASDLFASLCFDSIFDELDECRRDSLAQKRKKEKKKMKERKNLCWFSCSGYYRNL